MSKSALRESLKSKLTSNKESFAKWDFELSNHLRSLISELLESCEDCTVGVYSPLVCEPKWFDSLKELNIKVALVHMHDSRNLTYHLVSLDDVKKNKFGLKLGESEIKKSVTPDIVLVPGLGFTRSLERIGRGKGYFDSFLKKFKGHKVGVFYSIQEVEDVYCEAHDEKLDFIVTEKKIIRGI